MAFALFHRSSDVSDISAVALETPTGNQIEIESLYSLIATGTERLVAKGLVPHELYDHMAVPYMEGDFSFPIKYGYSLVGRVVTENHPLTGRIVHLLHPHQDRCVVSDHDVFTVPDGVTAKRATLASNLESALNGVWDAEVSVGDRVFIAGFGMIGSLLARLLSMMPCVEVAVMDIDPIKRKLAESMGFTVVKDVEEMDFDVAFNTSASGAGLQACINAVGYEGKVIEMSWYGVKAATLQLGGSFHSMRKRIISSQVSNLPANRRNRWDYLRRREVVFDLLRNEAFDSHIAETIPFSELPNLFDDIRRKSPSTLTWAVSYM